MFDIQEESIRGQQLCCPNNNTTRTTMEIIKIYKVKEEYGSFSCMSPHQVTYEGIAYRTCEAYFQSCRFEGHPDIQNAIREVKSPLHAKMIARLNRGLLNRGTKWDEAPEDIPLMKECLLLKLEQHPELKQKLIETGDATILEDCTSHDRESARFWGMVFKDGDWIGENHLGRIWMEIREEIK
jgi:ribA/ribD-fused uncharacterized protein